MLLLIGNYSYSNDPTQGPCLEPTKAHGSQALRAMLHINNTGLLWLPLGGHIQYWESDTSLCIDCFPCNNLKQNI
jgi:hypothetical protein